MRLQTKYVFFASLFVTSLTTVKLWAHPVSYKDSVGIMSYNTSKANELLLTYSLNFDFAVGTTYFQENKSELYIPRLDFLLKRWNNDDSQGNIYFSAGAGQEKYNNELSNVKLAELVADWESRKYYVYFENFYLKRNNTSNPLWTEADDNHRKLRLGFAPFLADYSDLNVWAIAQFSQHNNENIETTQFLRFYIKNTLWEIGSDFNGGFAFNFMIHI